MLASCQGEHSPEKKAIAPVPEAQNVTLASESKDILRILIDSNSVPVPRTPSDTYMLKLTPGPHEAKFYVSGLSKAGQAATNPSSIKVPDQEFLVTFTVGKGDRSLTFDAKVPHVKTADSVSIETGFK